MGESFSLETDVAIIGGGTAGLNAAMAAAEKGLRVLVAEKANIERSGAIAGGIDHFHTYLETGEPWDSREAYLGWVTQVSKGASNLRVQEAVFCLSEKIVRQARDLDAGMIFGTGFPPFRGGVLKHADNLGLQNCAEKMRSLANKYGDRYKPAAMLAALADKKRTFYSK